MTPSQLRHTQPVPVSGAEVRTARDASRTLGQILDEVNDGAEKIVIVRNGQMSGVVVSFERYAEMLAATVEQRAA